MTEASPRMYGNSFSERFHPHQCQLSFGTHKLNEDHNVPADFQVDEDETSIRVTMEMAGVKGSDISVSVEDGILTIQGYRRSMDGRKKQRLQRRFPVDTRVVDVSRAMANLWKDVLVLYAPKRSGAISIPVTEEPEFEFVSPAANRLFARDNNATQ